MHGITDFSARSHGSFIGVCETPRTLQILQVLLIFELIVEFNCCAEARVTNRKCRYSPYLVTQRRWKRWKGGKGGGGGGGGIGHPKYPPPAKSPPVVVLPPITNPPVVLPPPSGGEGEGCSGCGGGGGGGGGGTAKHPPPSTTPATCPVDALKLGHCVDVLGGLVHIGLGNPVENACCPVLQGLLELEAAICLCTTIRLKLLNLNIFIPLAQQALITCGITPPPGFVCPPLQV